MNKLKILRATRGLSLRQLAACSGVDQAAISLIENDRRKAQLTTLSRLSKALDVELEELIDLLDTTAAQRGRVSQQAQSKKRKQSQAPSLTQLELVPLQTFSLSTFPDKDQLNASTSNHKQPKPKRTKNAPKLFWLIEQVDADFYGPFAQRDQAERLASKLKVKSKIYEGVTRDQVWQQHKQFLLSWNRGEVLW